MNWLVMCGMLEMGGLRRWNMTCHGSKQASKRRDHEQALVAILCMASVVGWGRVGFTVLM